MFVAVGETMVRCNQIDIVHPVKYTNIDGEGCKICVIVKGGLEITGYYRNMSEATAARRHIIKQCMGEA